MRSLLALLLLGAIGLAAPIPKEVKTQTPFDQLQGRWIIVTMDSGEGQKVPIDDFAAYTVTFTGEKFSSSYGSGPISQNVAVKFDFEAQPMRMTINGLHYILKFEDGQLWKCHGQGAQFPTEFKGGNGQFCTVLKRADK